jgi:hypothetical protein
MDLKEFILDMLNWFRRTLIIVLLTFFVSASTVPMIEVGQRVQRYTRDHEFEFLGWTFDAIVVKFTQWSLKSSRYLSNVDRNEVVLEYLNLIRRASQLESTLNDMYADPSIADPQAAAQNVAKELSLVRTRQVNIQPVFEDVLSQQVSVILSELGLNAGGEIFPPVAFHFTRVPQALIVSPRDVIRQNANIQLNAGISLETIINLEDTIEKELDLSSLVVPVGGLGTYPTMIQESSTIVWVVETVIHEWIHNYLTFRPLGLNYSTSTELRTMNETVASILGREIGRLVLARYYPEHLPPPAIEPAPIEEGEPPVFDFRAEMRETRVKVDSLLVEGKIEEAERYMEQRRAFFWENGYRIRKINQAYFAFYGAYADEPGGAAGIDPVGAAVRELWAILQDPATFLRKMAWMTDFSDLEAELLR